MKEKMELKIDGYHVSVDENDCMKVYLKGQKVLPEMYAPCENRAKLAAFAINKIENYNREHGLRWGVFF